MAIINIPTKNQVMKIVNEELSKKVKYLEREIENLNKRNMKLEERIKVMEMFGR